MPQSHPFFEAVSELASQGVIGGYADGRFGPDDEVTRQQFAKMIVLAGGYAVSEADVCHFGDVTKSGAAGLFPDNYVAVCAARGITTGKTSALFDPYSSITRLQAVSMVVRAARDLRADLLSQPAPGWQGTRGVDRRCDPRRQRGPGRVQRPARGPRPEPGARRAHDQGRGGSGALRPDGQAGRVTDRDLGLARPLCRPRKRIILDHARPGDVHQR